MAATKGHGVVNVTNAGINIVDPAADRDGIYLQLRSGSAVDFGFGEDAVAGEGIGLDGSNNRIIIDRDKKKTITGRIHAIKSGGGSSVVSFQTF